MELGGCVGGKPEHIRRPMFQWLAPFGQLDQAGADQGLKAQSAGADAVLMPFAGAMAGRLQHEAPQQFVDQRPIMHYM